ncbi:MAG: hypothetical protein WA628_18375 [Terriglobales bacterium]
MRYLALFLLVLVPWDAEGAEPDASGAPQAQEKFAPGGYIRLHLSPGGYTIVGSDSNAIQVTCKSANSDRLKQVKVQIRASAASADVSISDTPHNNFQATIEVPRRSDLRVRLFAGEVVIGGVEGDKDVEVGAGRIEIRVPHPEQYGRRDASVRAGSIEASAFDVSKGGLFRSFEQKGPGKYRLHAHVSTGEIDLSAMP